MSFCNIFKTKEMIAKELFNEIKESYADSCRIDLLKKELKNKSSKEQIKIMEKARDICVFLNYMRKTIL